MKENFKEISKTDICETITEVWNDNVEEEFIRISKLIDKYNYIAMDTEFPGVCFNLNFDSKTLENEYRILKINVDNLKLIQVGISISNEQGNRLEKNHTWQFNLKFNLQNEKFHSDSINVLKEAGIDFNKLKEKGIEPLHFGELLTSSGLVYNDNIHWITFHGTYDFSYLLKNLINQPLPPTSDMFFKFVKMVFPNIMDVKILIQDYEQYRNTSLTKLGADLKIKRIGTSHQAGSDSLLTLQSFIELKENLFQNHIKPEKKNIIYGLSKDFITSNINYNFGELLSNNMQMPYNQNIYSMFKNEIDMNMMIANYQRQMELMINNPNSGFN